MWKTRVEGKTQEVGRLKGHEEVRYYTTGLWRVEVGILWWAFIDVLALGNTI